jgi:multisubunit Na+/H+ antiporter MnhG subunit
MIFGILTLFTALAMATVAAVFAIYGIIAIFAGMPQFALVMGAVIELGKVVGVSWLYRNWNEPTKIKYAMAPLVLVAMLLTSMGIFGLLSKAHLDQTAPVANNAIQIERLDQQVAREQSRIQDSERVVSQLDQSVQALINFDRIRGPDGAIAVRETQSEQRELLRQIIDQAQTEIDRLEDQKLELTQALRAIELEVGPIKYLAELIYNDGADRTEEAVRWVIIAFIFVFDPMAILLLMAANYTLVNRKKKEPKEVSQQSLPVVVEYSPEPEVKDPIEDVAITEDNQDEIDENNESNENITANDAPETEPTVAEEPEDIQEDSEDIQEDSEPSSEANVSVQQEWPVSIAEPEETHPVTECITEPVEIKHSYNPAVKTEGVTPVNDIGDGYVEFDNHLFQKDALKELRPDLFSLKIDENNNYQSGFGTQFPKIATKKDVFVRVDMMPNRVYRFDGKRWIELNKELSESYLYDQEYIHYLIDKIEAGEYDVDLLSEQEKIQIEEYLNQN